MVAGKSPAAIHTRFLHISFPDLIHHRRLIASLRRVPRIGYFRGLLSHFSPATSGK